jgi:hypothetical protein
LGHYSWRDKVGGFFLNEPIIIQFFCLLLTPTSDLGLGLNPSEICSALQNVYSIALDGGANVLAMTVPECYSWSERLEAARNQVNTWIKSYTADR